MDLRVFMIRESCLMVLATTTTITTTTHGTHSQKQITCR
jgi:hypothetical protein